MSSKLLVLLFFTACFVGLATSQDYDDDIDVRALVDYVPSFLPKNIYELVQRGDSIVDQMFSMIQRMILAPLVYLVKLVKRVLPRNIFYKIMPKGLISLVRQAAKERPRVEKFQADMEGVEDHQHLY